MTTTVVHNLKLIDFVTNYVGAANKEQEIKIEDLATKKDLESLATKLELQKGLSDLELRINDKISASKWQVVGAMIVLVVVPIALRHFGV